MKKLIFLLLFIAPCLYAADAPVHLKDPTQQDRYYKLIEEIRCLVCQNQSLADSHADLAQDLRDEIVEMIDAGKTNKEILQFLVDRYGDFVLYRPPLQENTWLLWSGPFIFLLVAIMVAIIIVRKQTAAKTDSVELTPEQQQQLSELTDKDSNQS